MNKKTMIAVIVIIIIAVVGYMAWKKKHEHPGGAVEHPGTEQEHPGEGDKGSSLDIPEAEQAVQEKTEFNAQEIKDVMLAHIQAKVEPNGGVLKIYDEKASQVLRLKFVKIHDPVRKIEGKGYFACTDFAVSGEAGKLYDLDFWLTPQHGQLVVTDTKIHKEPIGKSGAWEKKERYTFVNDNPVEVN